MGQVVFAFVCMKSLRLSVKLQMWTWVSVCVDRWVYVCACLCVERAGYVFGDMVVWMSVCVQIWQGECGDTRE